MSACKCDQRRKPISERQWRITRHRFAIHRGRVLSRVKCSACDAEWDTGANFVTTLAALGRKPL